MDNSILFSINTILDQFKAGQRLMSTPEDDEAFFRRVREKRAEQRERLAAMQQKPKR